MSREKCINCPQQHEPICCHKAINGLDEYDQRVNDSADQHIKVAHGDHSVSIYHVLIANQGAAK